MDVAERPNAEARHWFRLFLRGRMSAQAILELIGVEKRQREILCERGVKFSPHIAYRQAVRKAFLALVRSRKKIRAQKFPGRQRRYKLVTRGARYGRLRALRQGQPGRWIFRCDCGTVKEISVANVLYGRGTKSCGCLTIARRWPQSRKGRAVVSLTRRKHG
jgi:hypothetical protein